MTNVFSGPKPQAAAPKQPTQIKIPDANDPEVAAQARIKRQEDEKNRKGRESTNLSAQPLYSRSKLG